MIRAPLVLVKHVSCALLTLLLLLCALEVGLRCCAVCLSKSPVEQDNQRTLEAISWSTHHQLKPLETLTMQNPDTNGPVEVVTNSLGLRGREPNVPKPFGVYRVLCLGDESVLAAEVNESQTFCAQLEELLQTRTRLQVEVVNAGVPGFCPLLSYLQLKHSLLSLHPDLLILNFDMSDVADDHRYRRHTRMNDSAEPLACSHPSLDSSKVRPQRLEDAFLLSRWCKQQVACFSPGPTRREDRLDIDTPQGRYVWLKDDPPDWTIYTQQALGLIDRFRDVAERIHAGFVVATYPVPWQVSSTASNGHGVREAAGVPDDAHYRNRKPFELLAAYIGNLGVPFCDTSPAFASVEQPDRLYFRNAPRFSEEGHTLYARELARFVVDNVPGVWENGSFDPPGQQPMRQAFSANR